MTHKDTKLSLTKPQDSLIAAVDLGSNSFHMVLARWQQGEIRIIDRLSEKVQLGFGLDKNNQLQESTQLQAIACLERFAQLLQGIPKELIRIVGTNALRKANNSKAFVKQAQQTVAQPIEIISAYEEARLIYLGVAHTLADDQGKRLIIDIGGGSTELILGERFIPLTLESLQMGCVSYAKRFFSDGRVSLERFQQAVSSARRELLGYQEKFRLLGWDGCVGASGSIRAIAEILQVNGWCESGINRHGLSKLSKKLLKVRHYETLELLGLPKDRKNTIHAGCAILIALFDALDIQHMMTADGALREGVLYDLIGRLSHEDVRERTIDALIERYHIDSQQAARVESTAISMFKQVKKSWQLKDENCRDFLRWAAKIHEVGMAISHRRHTVHGAYLIEHSELPGFSFHEQLILAMLVKYQRRRIDISDLEVLHDDLEVVLRLCILLRIALIIHRVRISENLPKFIILVKKKEIQLQINDDWLTQRPLTLVDFTDEEQYLSKIGYQLVINPD